MGDIAATLHGIMRKGRLRLSEAEIALFEAWPGVVGEAIAAASVPERIEGDVLTVLVGDAAWTAQLRLMKQDIIDKLHAAGRPVRDIRFRTGAMPGSRARQAARPRRRGPIPPEQRDEIRRIVSTVEDETLRGLIEQVLVLAAEHNAAR